MYAPLARCDQRAKGEQYVRGLLLEGRRKSIQPMAARLPDGEEQGLQQFITDSPWEDAPVRRRLARRMTAEIDPAGWMVDDTGLPNCQVIVSVNAVTDRASCPLDWRLYLPAQWDTDTERRRKAKIPAEVRHRPNWLLALPIIDELLEWGLERRGGAGRRRLRRHHRLPGRAPPAPARGRRAGQGRDLGAPCRGRASHGWLPGPRPATDGALPPEAEQRARARARRRGRRRAAGDLARR
jgi:hypothetical protein